MKLKHLIKTGSRLWHSLFTSSRKMRVQSREPGKFVLVAALALAVMYGAYAQSVPGRSGSGLGLGGGTNDTGAMTETLPDVPTPVVKAILTNGTQVAITITNGVSYANYELYGQAVLDLGHRWGLMVVGAPGQTNFLVDVEGESEFFRVCVGSDWDGDHVDNASDADPLDPLILALTITVDGPTENSVIY